MMLHCAMHMYQVIIYILLSDQTNHKFKKTVNLPWNNSSSANKGLSIYETVVLEANNLQQIPGRHYFETQWRVVSSPLSSAMKRTYGKSPPRKGGFYHRPHAADRSNKSLYEKHKKKWFLRNYKAGWAVWRGLLAYFVLYFFIRGFMSGAHGASNSHV